MITLSTQSTRVTACPISSLFAGHYVGAYADPCRCTEYEQMATAYSDGEHVSVTMLGLRPRTLRAARHAGLLTTRKIMARPMEDLLDVHGLTHLGLSVMLYRMARRGIIHQGMLEMTPGHGTRAHLQHHWESVDPLEETWAR